MALQSRSYWLAYKGLVDGEITQVATDPTTSFLLD